MPKATVYKEVSNILEFEAFGKFFRYNVLKKHKKVDPKSIVNILNRQIVQMDYEWGRKDDKKVILFYTNSDIPNHVKYIFSVEADLHLQDLMNKRYEDTSVVSKMLNYMFDNHEILNFI